MTRPWLRRALVFAGLAAIAAAGLLTWSPESRARAAEAALRQADDAGRRALADAADLRAAQQAYVAVGQGEDFWFARVAALSRDFDEVLSIFKSHLASQEAVAAADEAAAAIQSFSQIDARAREYTRARQLQQASDVIFGDGFDVSQKLSAAVTRALTAEHIAYDAALAGLRREQLTALAAGAGVAALVLLLLVPGGRRRAEPEPVVTLSSEPTPLPMSRQTLTDLNDFDVVGWPSAPAATAAPAAPEAPAVDLAAVAAICSDLSRVGDTRAIAALLERTAALLDASGIVLWVADPDGRELTPILVHGYSPKMATRLGTIAREAANVTASAYRTGLLQTVKSDSISNGAIAAPLLASGGCVGVMAVEMKNGGEQREPLLAAATIIAAQVSTLVGPPSARTRAEAAG
jgi:hypothetical protein